MLSDILGGVAAVLTTAFAWPQAMRALRGQSSAGLSLPSTLLMATSGLLWSAYGAATGSPYIVVANVSVALAALATAMVFRGQLRREVALGVLAAVVGIPLAAAVVGPSATGTLGVVVAGTMTLPQAVLAVRARGSLGAVSPLTYVLLATNAACWIGYGLTLGDALVVAPNLVTLPASLLILTRLRRGRGGERAHGAESTFGQAEPK